MAKYTVTFNPRVGQQLERHTAFIANVSKPAAWRLLDEFKAVVKQLAKNPYLYAPCDDPNLPADIYRKAFIGKWYKVVFTVDGDQVYIEAVVDARSRN